MVKRTFEIDEQDLEIILEALRKLRNHYKGCSERTKNSGYCSVSTMMKADSYLAKCHEIDRIETEIAYQFI